MKARKDNALEQHIERSMVPPPSNAAILERRFYDDFDDIYRFYHDPTGKIELTDTQQRQLTRWRWIREWMIQEESDTDRDIIVAILHEFEIGEKQAYIDLKNTKRFFSAMEPVQKEFEKVMMIEKLKRQQKRLLGDLSVKAEAALIKNQELLAKIMGLYEPENQMPVPVVVEVNPVFDPAILGVDEISEDRLEKLLKAYGQKKEEKRRLEIEDVDFEMIMSNGNSPD